MFRKAVLFWGIFYTNYLLRRRKIIASIFTFAFAAAALYTLFIHHPTNFPTKYTFNISAGASISSVAISLKKEGLIKSPFVFKAASVLTQTDSGIFAGDYYFHSGENVFTIVNRVTSGDFRLTPLSVLIPEGSTIFDIAEILESNFTKINGEKFIKIALKENAEGYLFPDTYQFLPNTSEKKIYKTMRDNFDNRISSLEDQILSSSMSLEEIIIMASLIERESSSDLYERRTISGILWNRISIGMALQVDAVFLYINGKNTYEISIDDLKIDSPYNTYQNTGLPIGPISNPSLDSIIAALDPLPSNFLYYLHDKNGDVHYSVDFEGHKQNKFQYLR